jgi:ADP-ribose pyrophosphatase YjhB (NUDIX family)
LVAIGAAIGLRYPVRFLVEAGIRFDGNGEVSLAELPDTLRDVLASRLSIPLHRPATFLEMERIYRLRSPITKAPAAFTPLCHKIALDYQQMGVRYVELSLGNVLQSEYLRDLHRLLPALEEHTGVTLRFLAALSRHNDVEWDLDCIERIAELGRCRYLVGVDFMGHETNSTRAFTRQIRAIAEWAHRERPGFVIRVHAGENAAYPENVRVAVESTEGCDVMVRIGHGLYGVDSRTMDVLSASGTTVEFNLNSNYALNNLQNASNAPIRRYIEHGIPVVLGTDGYGIYQTTTAFEVQAARLCGLTDEHFARIVSYESKYVDARRRADLASTTDPEKYQVPEDSPSQHYTAEVAERRRQAIVHRDDQLERRLAQLGTPLLSTSEILAQFSDRRSICFSGAWTHSWRAISPNRRASVREEMSKLFADLSTKSTLLITGGTCHGFENVIQELARPLGFTILAAIVRETPPDGLHAGAFTHAAIVGEKLYDKAAGLYRLIRDLGGLCVFVGGGAIVSDEIQTATNLRVPYLLMDGPEGASTEHAREQPDRAFRTADDVLGHLEAEAQWASPTEPYWHLGENPTVDLVLTRLSPGSGRLEILLIRRDEDAPAEPGKWALPGGFVRTDAPRGTPWRGGLETERDAAIRELREETSLDLSNSARHLIHVGDYAGGGRDPRDTPQAWSRTSVFALHLDSPSAAGGIAGNDDASEAAWVDVQHLPPLAFDHARIISDALGNLRNR